MHPRVGYYWRWAQNHGNWATMIRCFPEMRREVLWQGVFTKRRHAAFIAGVVGLAAGIAWSPALALAVPYAWYQRPRSLNRNEIIDHLLGTAFDTAVVIGMLRGSVRERTLVL